MEPEGGAAEAPEITKQIPTPSPVALPGPKEKALPKFKFQRQYSQDTARAWTFGTQCFSVNPRRRKCTGEPGTAQGTGQGRSQGGGRAYIGACPGRGRTGGSGRGRR